MKIALIAPPIMDFVNGRLAPIAMDAHRECPPYGVYVLASVLRQEGHDVVVIDLIAQGSQGLDDYRHDIDECSLVGISATSMSWPTALDTIRTIRLHRGDVPIVLGGIHPTMFDRYLLSTFPIDYIIRGEGEIALLLLVEALERSRPLGAVPNLSWKDASGTLRRNPIGPKISEEQLSSFPLPDFSCLPSGAYLGLSIESSRGCAFDCAFCSTSYRKSWRGMQPVAFVDRLQAIMAHVERTQYRMIHIVDDEFSMNPKRAIAIAGEIARRGFEPSLVYDSRANDLLFEGYVESIAPFTNQFLIGAECGYDEGLKQIGKGTTCEKLDLAASKLARAGIAGRADFSFVLGLPWESKEEVKKTVRFAAHLHATYGVRALLQWYCEIPGSRLWDEDYRAGLVTEAMYNSHGFFRNLYLFRTGVKLMPSEVYEVSEIIEPLLLLSRVRYPEKKMIEYAFPEPIAENFPRIVMGQNDVGLASLRQVARPGSGSQAIEVLDARQTQDAFRLGRPLRNINVAT